MPTTSDAEQKFNAERVLSAIWPEWRNPVLDGDADDLYVVCGSSDATDIMGDLDAFLRNLFYIGESEKEGENQHLGDFNRKVLKENLFYRKELQMSQISVENMVVHKLPVPSKKIGKNIGYTFSHKFKWQVANREHGNCTMLEIYLLQCLQNS
uniref:Zf-RVT domain-containing protein n=1 Tax=Rhabditophanes sp. KR3021 TaxID=114890 RepID=A0AC35TGY9_9BILA